MITIGLLFVRMLGDRFKSPGQLEVEILVLRYQLNILQRAHGRRLPILRLSVVGHCTASAIASTSRKSFFCPLE